MPGGYCAIRDVLDWERCRREVGSVLVQDRPLMTKVAAGKGAEDRACLAEVRRKGYTELLIVQISQLVGWGVGSEERQSSFGSKLLMPTVHTLFNAAKRRFGCRALRSFVINDANVPSL